MRQGRRILMVSLICGSAVAGSVLAQSVSSASPVGNEATSAGAKLAAQQCASCHGANGQGVTPDFPSLAGQNEKYIVKQLRDFASGHRKSVVMDSKAAVLDDGAMHELAKFYQSQKPQVKPAADPALAAVGAFIYDRGNPYSGLPACVSCHGTGGRGRAELPRLAGQSTIYIERQLHLFADKGRANDAAVMSMIAGRMNELEIKAVAEHLGAMK
jgi:cytochrome c553